MYRATVKYLKKCEDNNNDKIRRYTSKEDNIRNKVSYYWCLLGTL